MMVIDTPEGIARYRLACLKQALKLQKVGLRTRGRAATTIARKDYGLRGNIDKLIQQVEQMLQGA